MKTHSLLFLLLALFISACQSPQDRVDVTTANLAKATTLYSEIQTQVMALEDHRGKSEELDRLLYEAREDLELARALSDAEDRANRDALRNATREAQQQHRTRSTNFKKFDGDLFGPSEEERRQKTYDALKSRYFARQSTVRGLRSGE
jgi:hypothetical protein